MPRLSLFDGVPGFGLTRRNSFWSIRSILSTTFIFGGAWTTIYETDHE